MTGGVYLSDNLKYFVGGLFSWLSDLHNLHEFSDTFDRGLGFVIIQL